MGDSYMTPKTGSKIVKMVMGGLIAILLLVGYTFYQSYSGRVDLVEAQRAECVRSKFDRADNAEGWRTAETARVASAAEVMHISIKAVEKLVLEESPPGDLFDLVAARKYNKIAAELEKRSQIDCAQAFPKAGLFP